MAAVERDRFIFVRLASRPTAIEVQWDEIDSDWPAGLAEIRDFAGHRRNLGPEPRLELPSHHPHREEYVYDSSSQFRYVNVRVVLEDDAARLHQQYGRDIVGDLAAPGPLRPWTDFMDTLLAEVERHS